MRFSPVTGYNHYAEGSFVVMCKGCDKRICKSHHPIYADLEGVAFQDYYCQQCVETFTQEKA